MITQIGTALIIFFVLFMLGSVAAGILASIRKEREEVIVWAGAAGVFAVCAVAILIGLQFI